MSLNADASIASETGPSARGPKPLQLAVAPLNCRSVDASRCVVPWFGGADTRPLSPFSFALLTSCAVLGLGLAGITLALILIWDYRDRNVLYPSALLSLVLTTVYCLYHAAHYQRELARASMSHFDFWFLSLQFVSATVCLADLLRWDYRCFCIVSWSCWFHWVLLGDAMLPVYKHKLGFRKRHAILPLVAVLGGILVIAFSLAFNRRDILHVRTLHVDSGRFSLTTTTGSFMAYRLVTIWLWTVRLVWRLVSYSDDDLVMQRASLAYARPVCR